MGTDYLQNAQTPVAETQTSSSPSYSSATGGSGNNFNSFFGAIKSQESGGNYGVVNSGSGALGAYQIMPSNIPSWSQAATGHTVTAQQFLKNPALQDQIAQYQLKNYYDKYGAAGAAVAWYAGPGTAQKYVKNPSGYNGSQSGGPSISGYAMSILKKMGLR
jgi:hypothetical protein